MAEYIVEVDAQGKVDIPLEIRKKLQVEEGDNLIFRAKEGKIEVEKLSMDIDDYGESLSMVGIVEI
jgi:AbrB family looped-hinge helix DNA binding protein